MMTEADLKALSDALGNDLLIGCGLKVGTVKTLVDDVLKKTAMAESALVEMATAQGALVCMKQELEDNIAGKDNTIRFLNAQIKKLKKARRESK